ncbi:ATP-binding protein [Kitasatospora sp. NPDC057015]|uniref:ATP-binding protein n=1 Tax=Kitasatospora sp. NPDC057015 TaxID=3346001 RepID=UPI00364136C3
MPETLDRPPPPAVTGEFTAWLPRHRRSAGAARRLLRDFLAGLETGKRYLDVGELLVSELVANAVEHARVPSCRLVGVRYELAADRLRIEVHDGGNGRPAAGEVPVEQESGRGLWLVRELSTAWGCHPREGGTGTCVWALLAPDGAPGEAA